MINQYEYFLDSRFRENDDLSLHLHRIDLIDDSRHGFDVLVDVCDNYIVVLGHVRNADAREHFVNLFVTLGVIAGRKVIDAVKQGEECRCRAHVNPVRIAVFLEVKECSA